MNSQEAMKDMKKLYEQQPTAKEMFEKFGYEEERGLKTDETTLIIYRNDDIWFFFHKVAGEIAFTKYRDVGFFHKPVDITLEELKAINKQIEELGWNND